jgi:hypothetical protein
MSTHRPRPGGRTTAAALVAATLSCGAAPPAHAASAVFGGATDAHEAIVVRTDAKAKKLRSIVIAWEAPCDDGMRFPAAIELTPAAPRAAPQPRDLLVARNANGRFAGTQLATYVVGTGSAGATVDIAGRLRGHRAAGTLAATVTILDGATGNVVGTCKTGSLHWNATRDAGHVYGGKTTQDEPVVVRLDRRRKKVAEVLAGWQSASCQPPDTFLRAGERFTDFPLRHARFGDAWDQTFGLDGGGKSTVSYEVAGKVARRAANGTLQVQVKETDAAGAVTMTCDSGDLRWRAATG